jgi:hypothetical protein
MNEIINVKEIFKTSFEIYKNNFQTFISISLIFAVIIVLLAQVSPVRGSGLSFIFTTISMLISSWFSMALMYASAALLQKKNITWQEALMLPKERFRMYVIVNAALFLLIISGFLLFIVPGVYLAVVYNFTSTITVLEKTEFKESFMRSAALVKGRFIQIMGFLALIVALAMVPEVVNALLKPTSPSLAQAINRVLTTVILPFFMIAQIQLYFCVSRFKSTEVV